MFLELICIILPYALIEFKPTAVTPEDFQTIWILLLRIFGTIHCYLEAKKYDSSKPLRWFAYLRNWVLYFFIAPIFIALVIRTFIYEPFNIPAGSMQPTLEIGEYVMAEKFTYGYGPYSFPYGTHVFTYIFQYKILQKSPERGDVVIFRLPIDTDVNFIKRIIALPGETIQIRKGKIYLNGAKIPQTWVRQEIITSHIGERIEATIYQETLPNGKAYEIMDTDPNGELDNTQIFTVPEGHYFMMGDNRDNSRDSRFLESVGPVPEINIASKAGFIFWNKNTHGISYKPIK